MSVRRSSGVVSGGRVVMATAAAKPVALLLDSIHGKNHDEIVGALVSCLHQPGYSIVDLLRDTAGLKARLATARRPVEQLIDDLTRLDRTVRDCVALTSLHHEKFIESTQHAYCELDKSNVVVYANAAMLKLAPDCLGHDLATRFGGNAREVRQALAGRPRKLYQLDLEASGGKQYPVLADFGEIATPQRAGGYALLIDLSDLVEAERKALEAAPTGMLKLNAKHHVLYANRTLLQLLELAPEDVIGKDARDFLSDQESIKEVNRQGRLRRQGRGGEFEIWFKRPKSGTTIRLRLTGCPLYDAAGEFSGMLTSIVPIDREIARNDIARVVATESNHREMFYGILEIIRKFIPFDWADLVMFTRKRDFALSVCSYPKGGTPFKTRWFEIPPTYYDFISRPCPCVADLKVFLQETPEGRGLLEHDPEYQRAVADGRRALIELAIRIKGKIIGALSLQSKEAGIYGPETLGTLRDLAVDQALQTVFNLQERSENEFVSNLSMKLSSANDHNQLAGTIVTEVGAFYDFQNVSIFKVNALRRYFSLLAQHLGPQGGSKIPEHYTQPLDQGMLGLAYRRREIVNLGDRHDGSEAATAYKEVAPETVSELCIPIKLRGRILWILNLEDPRRNAFNQPEIETLQRIVRHIDATIDHLFQGLILYQVLLAFPEAVVITNKDRSILLCNKNAQEMFELPNVLPQTNISAFLKEDDLKIALSENTSPPWTTEVRGSKGKETPVLLSKFLLPEEYDHVVLLLQDVTELQWTADIERLKAALAEAASQVRVPLSLVSSFVREIGQKTRDLGVTDLVSKAVRQLGRIELTYDRVFASYDADKLPAERKNLIELNNTVERILAQLPAADRETIELTPCKEPSAVSADPYRLTFALESMLAYLVRSRANSSHITLRISKPDPANIEVVMTGPVTPAEASGALERMVEATRTQIALGEDLLARIAAECGGTYSRKQESNERDRLSLRLPLVSG
jgi:PAS domain S-box-containing protein